MNMLAFEVVFKLCRNAQSSVDGQASTRLASFNFVGNMIPLPLKIMDTNWNVTLSNELDTTCIQVNNVNKI